MGKFRQSVCLLLSLFLLVGCGQVSESSKATPTPLPLAIASVSQQDSTPEAKSSPTPEVRPALRLSRLLPPKQPPPPPPSSHEHQAPRPRKSDKSSYPKAQPPALSLETNYPKAGGTSKSEVEKAEAASRALDSSIQSGRLQADFHGTGDPWRMVHFRVYNAGARPVRVQLVSGMILNPDEHHQVQPLLVAEDADFVLQPGESYTGDLISFCMDSRVPAPLPGEPVNYRFSARTRDGGPAAVRAQKAAEELVQSSPYRHAVTQIAIWKSLNQPVEEKHWVSVLGVYAKDPRIRQEVSREVERVLKSI